jgi:hypothetical protein
MNLRASLLAAALVLAPVGSAVALPGTAADDAPEPQVVATFQDEAIEESSGAVVRGDRLFTVNDSGDGAYLYEVDLRTGETVGVTTFAGEEPQDVEALASGAGDAVWVGDIGDNRRSRSSVTVHRFVPVPGGGHVAAARFELTYPDRPHDAEALLAHPRTGRLLVVTKSFTRGGTVYRGPGRLEPGATNRLERVGSIPGLVTGGAFLPGGDRILLRTYGAAAVYSYPALRQLVHFALPAQEQGEAVAVGDDGRVYLTSEGEGSDVLVLDLPEAGAAPGAAAAPHGSPAPAPAPQREPGTHYDPQPWMGLGPAGLLLTLVGSAVALGLLWLLLRASRRRGRRRR